MLLIDENGNIQRLDDPPERYDLPEWQEYNRLYDHMEQQGTGSIDEMRADYARYRETAKRAPWWRGWFLAIACLVGGRLFLG